MPSAAPRAAQIAYLIDQGAADDEDDARAQILARLRDIAAAAGYRLVKKPSKKDPNDN